MELAKVTALTATLAASMSTVVVPVAASLNSTWSFGRNTVGVPAPSSRQLPVCVVFQLPWLPPVYTGLSPTTEGVRKSLAAPVLPSVADCRDVRPATLPRVKLLAAPPNEP